MQCTATYSSMYLAAMSANLGPVARLETECSGNGSFPALIRAITCQARRLASVAPIVP